jgi:hypothetical protein
MRGKFLLLTGLALLLGSCFGGGTPPPPLKKDLLTGKWKNSSDLLFVSGCEFAADGTAKLTMQGMEQPVAAHYSWSGDRTIDVQYTEAADVREAYRKAAAAYKAEVSAKVKAGTLPDKAEAGILGMVRDELPAKETLKVAIAERPPLLILTNDNSVTLTFSRVE